MLDFLVGAYSIEEFKKYYSTLSDLQEFYVRRTHREPGPFELGPDEEQHVLRNPDHLIIFTNEGEIVGHCIWHETSTEDMIPGDPREDEDKDCLHNLFEGERNNLVELHELWLRTDYRGREYGRQFFSFFEAYIEAAGFDGIVYYTDNEAAIALCRKRGYREAFLKSDKWYVFALPFFLLKE